MCMVTDSLHGWRSLHTCAIRMTTATCIATRPFVRQCLALTCPMFTPRRCIAGYAMVRQLCTCEWRLQLPCFSQLCCCKPDFFLSPCDVVCVVTKTERCCCVTPLPTIRQARLSRLRLAQLVTVYHWPRLAVTERQHDTRCDVVDIVQAGVLLANFVHDPATLLRPRCMRTRLLSLQRIFCHQFASLDDVSGV
jgi:hypothetical protein